MIRAITALAISLAVLGVAPAFADTQAEAVVLFDQGIKDMKAGRLDKACAELRSSLDLVKDSGTKGALARCHGLAGRVATAWLLWRELADTAPSAALRNDAAAQAAKLEPRLPRYTVTVARQAPEIVVEIDGRRVAANVSVPVPIDPGKLSVTASRRDGERIVGEPWSREYTAVEGQTVTIEIPVIVPIEVVVPPHDKPAPPPSTELADRRHRRHVVAVVIGGGALGAAGAGAYFGLQAQSRYDEANRACGGKTADCLPEQLATAQQRVRDARASATLSTVGFAVAGVAALTSILVWRSAPSLESKSVTLAPVVAPDQVGLVLGGAF